MGKGYAFRRGRDAMGSDALRQPAAEGRGVAARARGRLVPPCEALGATQ
jgi:hypothetical protein